jgi:branched-chain amino acid transport system permease protein
VFTLRAYHAMTLIIYGTFAGVVYGLWALSFAIIYKSVSIFHVFHAAVFTSAAYAAWLCAGATGSASLALLAGVAFGTALGTLSELLLYRPLIRLGVRPSILFVASLAAYIVLENTIQLIWRADTRTIDVPQVLHHSMRLGGAGFSALEVVEGVTAVLLWLGTLAILRFTLLGKAIRAVSTAPEMAALAGVQVPHIRLVVFLIGSFLISVAGVMFVAKVGIEPSSGMPVWIVAIVASLIGGSQPLWSFISGLMIGIFESLVLLWVPAGWQPAIPITILLAYLVALSTMRSMETMQARRRAARELQHA